MSSQALEAAVKKWGHQYAAFLTVSNMQAELDDVLDELDEAKACLRLHDLAENLSSDIDQLANELRAQDLELSQKLSTKLQRPQGEAR